MPYATEEIAMHLREARERKALSQRELSHLSGVPQAQISRIESNSIDLRLSTLITIANALDLEIALVPRKAVPAVKSIMRQTLEDVPTQPSDIAKEMRLLQRAIRNAQSAFASHPQQGELVKSYSALRRWPISAVHIDALSSIRATLERAISSHNFDHLTEVTRNLVMLRNQIAHSRPAPTRSDPPRPAYSLDEDDDG